MAKGSGKNRGQQGGGQMQTAPPTANAKDIESLVFLRIITDTLNVYQGEQANVTFNREYTRLPTHFGCTVKVDTNRER